MISGQLAFGPPALSAFFAPAQVQQKLFGRPITRFQHTRTRTTRKRAQPYTAEHAQRQQQQRPGKPTPRERDLNLPSAHDVVVPDLLHLFPQCCQHHCHAEPEVTTRRRVLLAGKALLLAATCPCCAQLAQAEEHAAFSYAGDDTGPSAWPGALCIAMKHQ